MATYNPPQGPPPGPPPAVCLMSIHLAVAWRLVSIHATLLQRMFGNMHADVSVILQNRRASVDELGTLTLSAHATPQFSSLPVNQECGPIPTSSAGPAQSLPHPLPYDSRVVRTEESQSLMASIADALSQSHRGFSLEDATSVGHPVPDEPVPKYEPIGDAVGRSAQSEPHAPVTNGHVGSPPVTQEGEEQWHRRTTRRSTSPPNLPPGAAPAAVRAWDDRMGQGEDGAHSDHPASSSARMPSQRPISSSEPDGEEDGLAYDRKSLSLEERTAGGDGKQYNEDTSFSESGEASVGATTKNYAEQGPTPIQKSVSTGAGSSVGDGTSLSRTESRWRISRVPAPHVDADVIDTHHPSAYERQSLHSIDTGTREDKETRTDESIDEQVLNAVVAREVSREMDALAFSAAAPSSSGYSAPRAPLQGHEMAFSVQSQTAAPYPHASPPPPHSHFGRAPYSSTPSSPIAPSNSPFVNRGRTSPIMETRQPRGNRPVSNESIPSRLPTPAPIIASPAVGSTTGVPSAPRSTSPMYRSPPPEYPRPTPPFSSPLMASSTSSLTGVGGGVSPGGAPRTISAAAFRRQQGRSPSGADVGPADTSPLTLRKPSGSPSPSLSPSLSRQPQAGSGSASLMPVGGAVLKARLSVVNPDPRVSDEEEEFDYVGAYGGESAGYGAGRYVSDLERDG